MDQKNGTASPLETPIPIEKPRSRQGDVNPELAGSPPLVLLPSQGNKFFFAAQGAGAQVVDFI